MPSPVADLSQEALVVEDLQVFVSLLQRDAG